MSRWQTQVKCAFAALLSIAVGATALVPSSAEAADTAAYIGSVAPLAQKEAATYGVPASVAIAQSILESGWGASGLTREANNYFGIKCPSSGNAANAGSQYVTGCLAKDSYEYPGPVLIRSWFRVYGSAQGSFLDHGLLLSSRSWYAPAFAYKHDPDQFIREVAKGGYATDPTYADMVISIMRQYNLYRFDARPAATVTQSQPASTAAPTKPAPTTAAPTKPAPTTAAPTSAAPTSAAPTSAAPTSAAPTSAAPTSAAPTSAAPTTAAPTTAAPTTAAPTTAAPTSAAPTKPAPTTAPPATTSVPAPLPTLSYVAPAQTAATSTRPATATSARSTTPAASRTTTAIRGTNPPVAVEALPTTAQEPLVVAVAFAAPGLTVQQSRILTLVLHTGASIPAPVKSLRVAWAY